MGPNDISMLVMLISYTCVKIHVLLLLLLLLLYYYYYLVLIYCSFNISCVVPVCLFYCCYIRFLSLYLVVNVKFW